MKRALISPDEHVATGIRIAQVVATKDEFPVAPPLFFIDVADNVTAEGFFYDGATVQLIPAPVIQPTTPNPDKQDAIAKANALAVSGSAVDIKAFAAAIAKVL